MHELMSKKAVIKIVSLVLLVAVLAVPAIAFSGQKQATLTYRDIVITLDGDVITPKDAGGKIVEPFVIDGTTYLPVRGISGALDLDVDWDSDTNTVILKTKETVAEEEEIDPEIEFALPKDLDEQRMALYIYNELLVKCEEMNTLLVQVGGYKNEIGYIPEESRYLRSAWQNDLNQMRRRLERYISFRYEYVTERVGEHKSYQNAVTALNNLTTACTKIGVCISNLIDDPQSVYSDAASDAITNILEAKRLCDSTFNETLHAVIK